MTHVLDCVHLGYCYVYHSLPIRFVRFRIWLLTKSKCCYMEDARTSGTSFDNLFGTNVWVFASRQWVACQVRRVRLTFTCPMPSAPATPTSSLCYSRRQPVPWDQLQIVASPVHELSLTKSKLCSVASIRTVLCLMYKYATLYMAINQHLVAHHLIIFYCDAVNLRHRIHHPLTSYSHISFNVCYAVHACDASFNSNLVNYYLVCVNRAGVVVYGVMSRACNTCGVPCELTGMTYNRQEDDSFYYKSEVWHSPYTLLCPHSGILELACCAICILYVPNVGITRRRCDRLGLCYSCECNYTKVVLFCCRWIPWHHRMESACSCHAWAPARRGELDGCQYIDPQHTALVNFYHQLYRYWNRRPDFDDVRDVLRMNCVLTSSLPFVKGCLVDDTECDAFACSYHVVGTTTHQSALPNNAIHVMLRTFSALAVCSTLGILSLYDNAMSMLYIQKCAWEKVPLYQYVHGI